MYFILHAVFGLLLLMYSTRKVQSRYTTLGLAEPLNCGLIMPPGTVPVQQQQSEGGGGTG